MPSHSDFASPSRAEPARQDAPAARTVQGRRVVTIEWHGAIVEAVEGLEAVKVREAAFVAGEGGLMVGRRRGERPPLGIVVRDRQHRSLAEDRGSMLQGAAEPIEWSEPLLIDRGSAAPNDPYLAQQWALNAIAADSAWAAGHPGDGVVVAVLDSGVPIEAGNLSHSDLKDSARIHLGRDVINQDPDPADDHGHGTHVLGILAATQNNATGIAGLWAGHVFVVKVFNSALDGTSVSFKDGIAAAVDFARERGARLIVNYSGGGPEGDVKRTAVEYARDEGALLVAAAGNRSGAPVDFPAAYSELYDHVIAVGAVDEQNLQPPFGSRGPGMTVVAPGVGVLSTLPNYAVTLNAQGKQTKYDVLDGTSQAAPHVTALAALVWAKKPAWSADRVREHLRSTTDGLGPDVDGFGSGIINVTRALASL